MTFYMMTQTHDQIAAIDHPNRTVQFLQEHTSLWQMELQNVSYTANFDYINGNQSISLNTSQPLNNVSYVSKLGTYNLVDDPHQHQPLIWNQAIVENFAYQAVMEAFANMITGSIKIDPQQGEGFPDIDVGTSMPTTPLIHENEMESVFASINSRNRNFTNVWWNGVSRSEKSQSHLAADIIQDMFQTATLSLLGEAALK